MRRRHRVAAVAANVIAAGVAVSAVALLSVIPASGHNNLIDSTPEDGSTITTAPAEIELQFDQLVQNEFPQVAVIDGDENHYESGEPEIVGETVTQPVSDLPSGRITVSYRVVGADGHPVDGSISFTVDGGTDQEPESGTAEADEEPDTDQSFSAGWVVLIVAVVVAALGTVVYTAGRGRRRTRDTGS